MKIGVKQSYVVGFNNELEEKIWKKIYRTWYQHNLFCYDSSSDRYYCYGAVGWKICDEWNCYNPMGLINFYHWARPQLNTINDLRLYLGKDLLDNGLKLIRPESCRWITNSENTTEKNKRYAIKQREIMQKIGKMNKGRKLKLSEAERKRRSEQMKIMNANKDYKAQAIKVSKSLKEYNKKRKQST